MRRWSYNDSYMDSKGARMLAELLERRHGVLPEVVRAQALKAADALPLFHWFGVEPAPSVADSDPPAEPQHS